MFANTMMGGMNFAFPDVCKTPSPVGPIPIPYPNMSMGMTRVPPCFKVFMGGTPAHNMNTMGTISNGDNAGVAGGVASQMDMGPDRHMMGSFGVFLQGMPATKMTSMTGQNGMSMNAPGMTLVPAQFKVMILK
ncbi:MAG: DUF4150 domain-containing protein [Desulfobacteraceae bacterium]|nr:MAG: DUF4150 domain-containing protein [Desulfobacteraceae bacterium]